MLKHEDILLELHQYVENAEQARRKNDSHDSRRHRFLSFLQKAFGIQSEEFDIEKGVKALKLRGSIDSLYKDLVFEFKRDLSIESEDGKAQLVKYLSSPQVPKYSFGILTDGVIFEIYKLIDGALRPADNTIDLKAQEKADPNAVLLWFDSFLFSQRNLEPKSDDVVRRFGATSVVFAAASIRLQEMFHQLKGDKSTQVKFNEWNSLLAKVYGSRDIGTAELFLRHTYLSLLAKVIAYAALFRRRSHTAKMLAGIADGEAFRQHGYPNLAEEDFFSWVLAESVRNETVALLRGFIDHLYVYDLAQIKEDLMKELYQGLVDPETRHDLGEFYTPDWLAELTLREAGYQGEGSVLDPACGSGTFLFTAIRLAHQNGKHGAALAEYALANIMGVDVHPLAVTISKVNYALALSSDLQEYKGSVPIPVYMADALLREEKRIAGEPIEVVVSSKKIKQYKSKEKADEKFLIPADMARNPKLLDEIVETMCEYARGTEDKGTLAAGFGQFMMRREINQLWISFWLSNAKLMIDLVRAGRDTIWGFILRNAYRPIYLSDRRFDFVVGNPPWLSYRYIQDTRYQTEIKSLVFGYGLLEKSDVELFNVIDTSTLFYEFCSDRYLKPRGKLAFVMPKSVLTGARQHQRFQQFGFTKAISLEQVAPLFNVPTCVLIRHDANRITSDFPMLSVSGALPARNLTWSNAKSFATFNFEVQHKELRLRWVF